MNPKIEIVNKNCLDFLTQLPDNSVDAIITSPPYYGLRDYGNDEQIGLEKTLDQYIENLLSVTKECMRVLKKEGSLWWNHGDSYATQHETGTVDRNTGWRSSGNESRPRQKEHGRANGGNIPIKSLMAIPYRLIIKMVDEQGWILRNQILWHKPNSIPSSAKDRFTIDYEPVFFFVKSKKYYFKQQFEKYTKPMNRWGKEKLLSKHKSDRDVAIKQNSYRDRNLRPNPNGRNKRCVWEIATKPFKDAHFATFPKDLVRNIIDAGCPENGVVLDPFAGAGTTLVVAKEMGRSAIGIELNEDYCVIARKRINNSNKHI